VFFFLGKLKICSVILFKEFIKVHFKVQYKNIYKQRSQKPYTYNNERPFFFFVGINERKMI
jgi:hypothetical protein